MKKWGERKLEKRGNNDQNLFSTSLLEKLR